MDAKRLLILITLVITIPLLVGQVPPASHTGGCAATSWGQYCPPSE